MSTEEQQAAKNDAHNAGCAITHGYNACTCATFAENDARCRRCCGGGWTGTRHDAAWNAIGHYHCSCGAPCAVDRSEGCTGARPRDAAVTPPASTAQPTEENPK